MNIPWKDPEKELPEDGEQIWVLTQHWKKNGPLSITIFGGEATRIQAGELDMMAAINKDYLGEGWRQVALKVLKGDILKNETHFAAAWCRATELDMPNWLLHKKQ